MENESEFDLQSSRMITYAKMGDFCRGQVKIVRQLQGLQRKLSQVHQLLVNPLF